MYCIAIWCNVCTAFHCVRCESVCVWVGATRRVPIHMYALPLFLYFALIVETTFFEISGFVFADARTKKTELCKCWPHLPISHSKLKCACVTVCVCVCMCIFLRVSIFMCVYVCMCVYESVQITYFLCNQPHPPTDLLARRGAPQLHSHTIRFKPLPKGSSATQVAILNGQKIPGTTFSKVRSTAIVYNKFGCGFIVTLNSLLYTKIAIWNGCTARKLSHVRTENLEMLWFCYESQTLWYKSIYSDNSIILSHRFIGCLIPLDRVLCWLSIHSKSGLLRTFDQYFLVNLTLFMQCFQKSALCHFIQQIGISLDQVLCRLNIYIRSGLLRTFDHYFWCIWPCLCNVFKSQR